MVAVLFEMATDREVIAKYADATNSRSGCPRKILGRGIALPDLRKEIEFESSFDGGSLLIGEDRVHEQIRRAVGHVCAPWCRDVSASYISPRSLAAPVDKVRFGSKADMCGANADVRFVPLPNIERELNRAVRCYPRFHRQRSYAPRSLPPCCNGKGGKMANPQEAKI